MPISYPLYTPPLSSQSAGRGGEGGNTDASNFPARTSPHPHHTRLRFPAYASNLRHTTPQTLSKKTPITNSPSRHLCSHYYFLLSSSFLPYHQTRCPRLDSDCLLFLARRLYYKKRNAPMRRLLLDRRLRRIRGI